MTIGLTIMRKQPITRTEFLSLVEADPVLSFPGKSSTEAKGENFLLRHHVEGNIDVELGTGDFQHPSKGFIVVDLGSAATEKNMKKIITLADRLNGRVFQDTGSSFLRIADGKCEQYKDDEYYLSAVKNTSANWMSPEQIAQQNRRERYALISSIIVFCLILGVGFGLGQIWGTVIAIVPAFFVSRVLSNVIAWRARCITANLLINAYFSGLLLMAILILYGLYFIFFR